jgi:Mg-chelatase subunit ChlD
MVHPADGTQWAHFVLGSVAPDGEEEPSAFDGLVASLRDPHANAEYLANGVRPVVEASGGAGGGSGAPSNLTVVGDPGPPPASLPKRRLVRSIRGRARKVKRSPDVGLVLDVSSSMGGYRLAAAARGVLAFLDRLTGADANTGIIAFGSTAEVLVDLQPLPTAGPLIRRSLAAASARGSTALLDGVDAALDMLEGSGSPDNLKVIVVLTDGEENTSRTTVAQVAHRLRRSGYLFFGIAYGRDAGCELLQSLASSGGGHSLVTDESGIAAAYELLAQHV